MSKFFIFAPNDDNMYYYNPEGIVYVKFYRKGEKNNEYFKKNYFNPHLPAKYCIRNRIFSWPGIFSNTL